MSVLENLCCKDWRIKVKPSAEFFPDYIYVFGVSTQFVLMEAFPQLLWSGKAIYTLAWEHSLAVIGGNRW